MAFASLIYFIPDILKQKNIPPCSSMSVSCVSPMCFHVFLLFEWAYSPFFPKLTPTWLEKLRLKVTKSPKSYQTELGAPLPKGSESPGQISILALLIH